VEDFAMRPLPHCLLAAALLVSVPAVAGAQAGRYIPIPTPAPGGVPFHLPHLPWHGGGGGGDSDWVPYVLAALGFAAAAWVGWAVGRGLAGNGVPGASEPALAAPAPDLIHEACAVAPKAGATRRLLEFLAHRDALLEPTALHRWAEESFLRVQHCWQNRDYGPLGDFLAPPLRAEHQRQLTEMIANGERNVLDGLRVERLEFVHLHCPAGPNGQELTALITFSAASYYVSALTRTFRRGSRTPSRFQEFWVFRREGSAWHLAAIERSHLSARLSRPNHVEGLTTEQLAHAEQSIAL
jgi:hypothetical protein